MYDDLFDEIYAKIDEEIENYKESLSWGEAQSFEQYAERVGEIKGLRLARQEVLDLQQLINKQEDE